MNFRVEGHNGYPERVVDADTGQVVAIVRSMSITNHLIRQTVVRMEWVLMEGFDFTRCATKALPEPPVVVTARSAERAPLMLEHQGVQRGKRTE